VGYDSYIKIEGLPGESRKTGFEQQIEILSFSFGSSNSTNFGPGSTGSAGGGRTSVSDFSLMKRTDTCSPQLFKNCCGGKDYTGATVSLNKQTGTTSYVYLKYEFEDVFVTSVQWSGSGGGGDDSPMESVSFCFGKVTVTYTPQKDDGTPGDPVVNSYDVRTDSVA